MSGTPAERRHPLAYTPAALETLADAVHRRASVRVDAGLAQVENAALTTGTFGQPAEWGANAISGPRMLHRVAGVPTQPVDAVLAEFPQLTLPTPQAVVGEGGALPEYDTSTAGTVVLGRFGRFSDLTSESRHGTSIGPVVGMHTIGVARDLDQVLVNAVETAAGAAEPFDADVPAAVRRGIARVLDATAGSLAGLVILVNPADAHLLQDVAPTGGNTIAEGFQAFSGALVYPSSSTDAGFVTVAALSVGVRYFEAEGLMTATDVADVKTDTLTVATKVTAGFAITLAGGFASKIDVVTP